MIRIMLAPFFTVTAIMFFSKAFASSIVPLAATEKTVHSPLPTIFTLKVKDLEKMSGRKFSLKQKIELNILRISFRKKFSPFPLRKADTDKGQLALILAITGLAALLIPYISIVSLPCAIAALIIGSSAHRKDPSNRKAKTAIVLGWITVAIFVLAFLILVALLSSYGWY